jgi:hypothetical protein
VFYPSEVVLSVCVLVAWFSLLVLIMASGVGSAGPWCHHYNLYATLTLALRSLGLSVARRITRCYGS